MSANRRLDRHLRQKPQRLHTSHQEWRGHFDSSGTDRIAGWAGSTTERADRDGPTVVNSTAIPQPVATCSCSRVTLGACDKRKLHMFDFRESVGRSKRFYRSTVRLLDLSVRKNELMTSLSEGPW